MDGKGLENLEARVIRLEENSWFQERKLGELEMLLQEFASQLAKVEKELENLGKHLTETRNEVFSLNSPLASEAFSLHRRQEK